MTHPVAIGVDIGGTKIVAGVVRNDGTVTDVQRYPSPHGDGRLMVEAITKAITDLGRDDLPVGVGVAGIVGRDGTLRYSPNHDVRDVPVGPWLRDELGVPPVVLNDATAALYAEYRFGAAVGREHVVMVTLGTGVGGGLLIGGRIVEGANGFAGEFGHMILAEGGRPCFCGNTGCFEAYASGTAMGRTASTWLEDGRGAESPLAAIDELNGKEVTEAALAGDEFARDVLRHTGQWLGTGVAALVSALDPGLVVIGGGASVHAAPWLLGEARRVLAERVIGGADRSIPDIVLAQMGNDAGMIGAGLLAAG